MTDTGIGISAEQQSKVFGRFYRAAEPLHGDFRGSGLGLVLGEWIAEQHHSTIELQSFPGNGSRFSILLPIHDIGQYRESIEHERGYLQTIEPGASPK